MFEKVPPFTPIDKEIHIFFDSVRFIVFACVVQDFIVSLQASVSKYKLSPVSVSVFSVIIGFLVSWPVLKLPSRYWATHQYLSDQNSIKVSLSDGNQPPMNPMFIYNTCKLKNTRRWAVLKIYT